MYIKKFYILISITVLFTFAGITSRTIAWRSFLTILITSVILITCSTLDSVILSAIAFTPKYTIVLMIKIYAKLRYIILRYRL